VAPVTVSVTGGGPYILDYQVHLQGNQPQRITAAWAVYHVGGHAGGTVTDPGGSGSGGPTILPFTVVWDAAGVAFLNAHMYEAPVPIEATGILTCFPPFNDARMTIEEFHVAWLVCPPPF